MQLFLSCHAMLLPKKWLFTFELHFLSKLFYQPTKWPIIIYQQIFCAKNEPLFYGGVLTQEASHCRVLFCFHKHGIKRLNFSKAKLKSILGTEIVAFKMYNACWKKAESVNFPLPKYFFGRKQLIFIRLVSAFSSGPVRSRCRPGPGSSKDG